MKFEEAFPTNIILSDAVMCRLNLWGTVKYMIAKTQQAAQAPAEWVTNSRQERLRCGRMTLTVLPTVKKSVGAAKVPPFLAATLIYCGGVDIYIAGTVCPHNDNQVLLFSC